MQLRSLADIFSILISPSPSKKNPECTLKRSDDFVCCRLQVRLRRQSKRKQLAKLTLGILKHNSLNIRKIYPYQALRANPKEKSISHSLFLTLNLWFQVIPKDHWLVLGQTNLRDHGNQRVTFSVVACSEKRIIDILNNKRSKADFTIGKIYICFTNISEGTAFLLQGLTYNDEVKLRRYTLK